jgi:molecular chaperone DnaK
VPRFGQALGDAGIAAGQSDEVVLVGGATRMRAIQDPVRALTDKEPQRTIGPDEVVAIGAAFLAAARRRAEQQCPGR